MFSPQPYGSGQAMGNPTRNLSVGQAMGNGSEAAQAPYGAGLRRSSMRTVPTVGLGLYQDRDGTVFAVSYLPAIGIVYESDAAVLFRASMALLDFSIRLLASSLWRKMTT